MSNDHLPRRSPHNLTLWRSCKGGSTSAGGDVECLHTLVEEPSSPANTLVISELNFTFVWRDGGTTLGWCKVVRCTRNCWYTSGKCCDIDCNYDCVRGALRLTQCRVASPLDAPCAVEVIRRLDQLEHLCQLANLQHRIEAQAEHPTFWRSALRGMTRYLV